LGEENTITATNSGSRLFGATAPPNVCDVYFILMRLFMVPIEEETDTKNTLN